MVRPLPLFARRATATEISARKLALAAATATLAPSAPALRARSSAAVTVPLEEKTGFPSATLPLLCDSGLFVWYSQCIDTKRATCMGTNRQKIDGRNNYLLFVS